jgi:MFS family permease
MFSQSRTFGKTLFFVMNTLGCFSIMILVDRLGRKSTLQLASSMVIACVFIVIFIDNWYIKMLFLGIANGCEGCFSNLFNILLNESVRKFLSKIINFNTCLFLKNLTFYLVKDTKFKS